MRLLLLFPILLLSFVFLSLFSGCEQGDKTVASKLKEADILMGINPDSAKTILRTISNSSLKGEQRAWHALLLSKAMNKTYENQYEDSLLSVAKDWYYGQGDSLEIQSLYYYGLHLFHARKYGKALVALTETYDKAQEMNDLFYSAMSARALGWTYHQLMIVEKDYEWARKAYELFTKDNKPYHAAWIQMNLANALVYNNKQVEADSVLNCIDTEILQNDVKLQKQVSQCRVTIYTDLKEYDKVLKEFDCLRHIGEMGSIGWYELSYVSALKGDLDLAAAARDSALALSEFRQDTVFSKYLAALISGKRHDYKTGYEQAMDWGEAVAEHTDKYITHPEYLILNDYLKAEAENRKIRLQKSRWIIISMTLVAICLVVLLLYFRMRHKTHDLEVLNQIRGLKDDIENSRLENADLKAEIEELFKTRYEIYDSLCEVWYNNRDDRKEVDMFKPRAISLLRQMQDEKAMTEIEGLIDRHSSNWMKRFRSLLGGLPSSQYQLAIYQYLDFSPDSIAALMNKKSHDNVYVMKSRLKAKISELDPEIATQILKDLHLYSPDTSKGTSKGTSKSQSDKTPEGPKTQASHG